jgi:hypothetical protein
LTDLLAPLRERYAHWLQLDPQQVLADREEAAADVRAMQLVLRMERADPPSWHRALAAAATGAAATEPFRAWVKAGSCGASDSSKGAAKAVKKELALSRATKTSSARRAVRPEEAVSLAVVTPMTTNAKTRGTTVICSALSQSLPTG